MRRALAIFAALALTVTAFGASAAPPAPLGKSAACTPSKNGKAVMCPLGGPYPLSSVCEPKGKGKMMTCRTVPPGTILTPSR